MFEEGYSLIFHNGVRNINFSMCIKYLKLPQQVKKNEMYNPPKLKENSFE